MHVSTDGNTQSIIGADNWYKYRWEYTVVRVQAGVHGKLEMGVRGTSAGGSTRSVKDASARYGYRWWYRFNYSWGYLVRVQTQSIMGGCTWCMYRWKYNDQLQRE